MDLLVPLETLYDLDYQQARIGIGLPDSFREFYGGDLTLVKPLEHRAVVDVNFVVRRDGVVNIPGASGGASIRGNSPSDRPLMALLRAAHDAILVGSETLVAESKHIWTPQFIYPPWGDALRRWRLQKGKEPHPLNVIVSRSGLIRDAVESNRRVPLSYGYPLFAQTEVRVLVVTTPAGAEYFRGKPDHANIETLVISDSDFELSLLRRVKALYGISYVLVEGGPTINASFHAAGLVSDDFLTLAPGMAGRTQTSHRATLMMGYEFPPENIPMPTLVSVRRSGSHLMIRERYESGK